MSATLQALPPPTTKTTPGTQPIHTAQPTYTAQPTHTAQPIRTAQPTHTVQPVRDILPFAQSGPTFEFKTTAGYYDFPTAEPPAPRSELPDVRKWAAAVTQATLDILLCRRQAGSLYIWFNPLVFQSLSRRAALYLRIHGRDRSRHTPWARTIGSHQLENGGWEISLLCFDGVRKRAAAMRVEIHRGHWRVEALEIG